MASMKSLRSQRVVVLLSLLGGTLLLGIGIRYLAAPEAAALTFGIPKRPQGLELHYITGFRNIWLGGMAVALATLREWRALALWFAMGSIVCFADAYIAASSAGRWPHVSFHVACGVASVGLSWAAFREFRKGG